MRNQGGNWAGLPGQILKADLSRGRGRSKRGPMRGRLRLAALLAGLALAGAAMAQPEWTHLSSTSGDLPAPNAGTQQTACLILDINNDGVKDFVVAERTETPSVVWYRRTASGWEKEVIDDTLLKIEAGGDFYDIDGDGDLDVSFGADRTSNAVWWWENPYPTYAPGVPWTRRYIKNSGSNKHHDQIFGDFDGDGQTELVFWNQWAGGKLFLAEIPADPRLTEPWVYTEIFDGASDSEGLAKGDIDGDGKVDIVGAGYWFKHNAGTDFTAHAIDAGQTFTRAAVGQLVAGGRPEVVFCPGDADGPLYWYQWDSLSETWVAHEEISWVVHGHSLAVADIDGDGHQDIFVAEMGNPGAGANAKMRILYGVGDGTFTEEVVSTGIGNHESKVGDLDGDGDLDILTKPYSYGAPRVDVWLQNGTGASVIDWNTY